MERCVCHPGCVPDDGDDLSLFGPEERAELERESALWWIQLSRAELRRAGGREFDAARPCPDCGTTKAALIPRNGQNTVRCARCGRHTYNAPRVETGEAPRTVATVRVGVKPSQQARILDRDVGRCVLCGRSDQPLVIGHLLSVEDGHRLGVEPRLLSDDANLAAMCEACNQGLSGRSVNPRTYAAIMWRLVQVDGRRRRLPRQSGNTLAR